MSKNYHSALTTFDNPFDPFDQFDDWYLYDKEKAYNSCEKVARIATFTDDMTQREINIENERAIDEIIKYDFTNVYKKVTKELKPFPEEE